MTLWGVSVSRTWWIFLVIFIVGLMVQPSALAGPFETYGFGSRSIGLGNAVTADSNDLSALYYNPANLADAPSGAMIGFLFGFNDLSVNLKSRPAGRDVPTLMYDTLPADDPATAANEEAASHSIRPLATEDLPQKRRNTSNKQVDAGVLAGLALDFGLDWFTVGMAVYAPMTQVADIGIRYADEREQYFTNQLHYSMIGNPETKPMILGSVAFKPLSWFKLGLGLNAHGKIQVKTHMFMPDPLDQENINLTTETKAVYALAIHAGMQFEPLSWLGIGLSFRDETWYPMDIDNELQFWNFEVYQGEPITTQRFRYTFSYTPRDLNLGFRFGTGEFWKIDTDVTWRMWSGYRVDTDSGSEAPFDDQFIPRIGAELRPLAWLAVRAGLSYVKSPISEQTGRTNYVDNDRVDATVGLGFKLPYDIEIDLHGQLLSLIERSHSKDENKILDEFPLSRDIKTDELIEASFGLQTNNPGYPGYSSKGFVGGMGVTVTVPFEILFHDKDNTEKNDASPSLPDAPVDGGEEAAQAG